MQHSYTIIHCHLLGLSLPSSAIFWAAVAALSLFMHLLGHLLGRHAAFRALREFLHNRRLVSLRASQRPFSLRAFQVLACFPGLSLDGSRRLGLLRSAGRAQRPCVLFHAGRCGGFRLWSNLFYCFAALVQPVLVGFQRHSDSSGTQIQAAFAQAHDSMLSKRFQAFRLSGLTGLTLRWLETGLA